jgi:uncharacterized ion transporter superfamily protein YfcC
MGYQCFVCIAIWLKYYWRILKEICILFSITYTNKKKKKKKKKYKKKYKNRIKKKRKQPSPQKTPSKTKRN